MMGLIIFIQGLCCILLVVVILMQSGRGGGLTEAFASAENMFGAKTNEVMVRATVILAAIFMVSNLILVHYSSQRERSLFDQAGTSASKKSSRNQQLPLTTTPVTNAEKAAK